MLARGLLIGIAASSATRAQSTHELRIEGGGALIRQNDRSTRNAGLLGALWRTGDQNLATIVAASFTYAGDSVTAGQLIGALAWRPTAASPWRTEGGVSGAAFGVYELGRGGNVSSYARERLVLPDVAFWIGGAAGHTMRDGLSGHGTSVDVGGSVRGGDLEARVSWSRVRSDDDKLLDAAGIFLQRDASARDLDDKTIALHYERARLSVDVSTTWRSGLRATLASQAAMFASAEYVISPRFSAAVTAGRQLADPVRGVPDVQVLSGMLRMVLLPWRGTDADGVSVRAFASVTAAAEGSVLVVRVVASDSQHVEVAGSFSGWEPAPLRRTADGWEARIVLGSGRHRVAVRIDGGPWKAPANLARVKDEFGGTSGLVVVP